LSLKQRLLLGLPRVKHREKESLGTRLRNAVLKPAEPDAGSNAKAPQEQMSVADLEAASKSANDTERLIGLLAAPVSAAIGLIVLTDLIAHDHQFLSTGKLNKNYVNVSTYHDLIIVMLGLSALMVVTAWFRKRLYLGMVMALFGLAIFNLHYWGFGIPFILGAAWLLVRSYRLQRDFKAASSGDGRAVNQRGGRSNSHATGPRQNKRYTPPVAPPKRPPPAKPPKTADQKNAV